MRGRELASNSKENGILQYINYEHYRRESPLALGQGFLSVEQESHDKAVVGWHEKEWQNVRRDRTSVQVSRSITPQIQIPIFWVQCPSDFLVFGPSHVKSLPRGGLGYGKRSPNHV
jgi:hypothetical protein